MPKPIAITATTTPIPAMSTVLSCSPKALMANAFTLSGVRSIAACPTVTTGDACGSRRPAASSATPIARPAATTPANAPLKALLAAMRRSLRGKDHGIVT